jgi:8-oxo-dGTP pyrophosphatase MutT (NUDIX family)
MVEIKDAPAHPIRLRVAGLIERNGSIAIIFDPVYQGGCWILPGGGAEFNETATEAIKREVFEETGLIIKPQGICSITEIWEPEKDFPQAQITRKSLEIIFTCSYMSGEINIRNNPSKKIDGIPRVKSCRWITREELFSSFDEFPLYPKEFFDKLKSNNLSIVELDKILLPPRDFR